MPIDREANEAAAKALAAIADVARGEIVDPMPNEIILDARLQLLALDQRQLRTLLDALDADVGEIAQRIQYAMTQIRIGRNLSPLTIAPRMVERSLLEWYDIEQQVEEAKAKAAAARAAVDRAGQNGQGSAPIPSEGEPRARDAAIHEGALADSGLHLVPR